MEHQFYHSQDCCTSKRSILKTFNFVFKMNKYLLIFSTRKSNDIHTKFPIKVSKYISFTHLILNKQKKKDKKKKELDMNRALVKCP